MDVLELSESRLIVRGDVSGTRQEGYQVDIVVLTKINSLVYVFHTQGFLLRDRFAPQNDSLAFSCFDMSNTLETKALSEKLNELAADTLAYTNFHSGQQTVISLKDRGRLLPQSPLLQCCLVDIAQKLDVLWRTAKMPHRANLRVVLKRLYGYIGEMLQVLADNGMLVLLK